MLFVSSIADSFAKITASADFTVSATVPNYQRLELDTAGHVITLGDGTTGGLMGNGTKISAADGKRPKGGKYVLTSFGGFDAEGVTVQLAAGVPDWVKSLAVNDDGNLELAVKRKGFTLIVK